MSSGPKGLQGETERNSLREEDEDDVEVVLMAESKYEGTMEGWRAGASKEKFSNMVVVAIVSVFSGGGGGEEATANVRVAGTKTGAEVSWKINRQSRRYRRAGLKIGFASGARRSTDCVQ